MIKSKNKRLKNDPKPHQITSFMRPERSVDSGSSSSVKSDQHDQHVLSTASSGTTLKDHTTSPEHNAMSASKPTTNVPFVRNGPTKRKISGTSTSKTKSKTFDLVDDKTTTTSSSSSHAGTSSDNNKVQTALEDVFGYKCFKSDVQQRATEAVVKGKVM